MGRLITSGAIGQPSGRPDSRSYDKVYSDGFGGILPICTYTDDSVDLDVESTKLLSYGGLEGQQQSLAYGTHLQVKDETDTAKTVWDMSPHKANTVHQVLVTVDNGVTWTVSSHTHDAINNTVTIASATQVKISFTAQNKPVAETTPQKVIKVSHKTVASNSHSIYKGAMVQNAITGKVAVGNSANGLESTVMFNAELDESGAITTVPTHLAITLNTDVSPAAKWFTSIVELSNGELGIGIPSGEDISTDKTGTTFTDLSKMYVKRLGIFK